MASALNWIPDSLYNSSISVVVCHYGRFQTDLRICPKNVQFDVFYKLYSQGLLCQLGFEFYHLDTFERMLTMKSKRHLLHHCFQALMDHGARTAFQLTKAYCQRCSVISTSSEDRRLSTIKLGLSLGGFLSDAGWFPESEKVIVSCLKLCEEKDDAKHWVMALAACLRLLHVRNTYCRLQEAQETFVEAQKFIQKLKDDNHSVNLAGIYTEFSSLSFCRSNYNEAYDWSLLALKELHSELSPKTIVDVLRQAAKTCVVKREFRKAEFLIKQALHTARINFDPKHPKFGDTLLDYGFYLLNVDSINKSVIVYQKALDVWQTAFGGYNLHVAIVHEDLAYASYVHEYSSGNFKVARDHAEKAMDIMHHLLPQDHLLLASSKRVKALILEEIAIDNQDKAIEHKLLLEAQELHLSALRLAQQAFGEMNVQTAKHYGNLGRLYQSMKKFNDAEEMHLKAIHIKKELLGPDDYEVALSVGHLASLYNYDMELFERAEELYLRSIEIGVKLFGEGYSGLEYDYRGLLRVYTFLGEPQKYMNYQQILQRWNEIRNRSTEREKHQCPLSLQMELVPPENLFPMLHSLE